MSTALIQIIHSHPQPL